MKAIIAYNKARKEIEEPFLGLHYVHTTLIKSLINLANPETGVVNSLTYRELAAILTVNSAPGRKDTGTPEKHLIRSYLRTIEKQCGDHFSVSSDGQQLKIKFLSMPFIYAQYFNEIQEVCTHVKPQVIASELYINTGQRDGLERGISTEEYTEVYTDISTPEDAVKNIFIYKNINKQTNLNKQTQGKKVISPDFYPDEPTITEALGKGMTKVLDLAEIQAFINHNRKHGSMWADFNPIFIKWLERDIQLTKQKAEKALQKQQETNNPSTTWSNQHASPAHPKPYQKGINASGSSFMDGVCAHHPNIAPGTLYLEAAPMYIE